jgi:catechol-2,3-dioxygenase
MKVTRLNHAVLFVSDLERALAFYTDVFGFEVIAREPRANAAFLRIAGSDNHHDLGLFGLGPAASPKTQGSVGLYHLAWQVDTVDDLADARARLLEAGALTGESSHGATKSVYGLDPDGNEFEVMWLLPRDAWGEYPGYPPHDERRRQGIPSPGRRDRAHPLRRVGRRCPVT